MISRRRMAISLKALILTSLLADGDGVLLAPRLSMLLRFGVSVGASALVAWAVGRGLDWYDRRTPGK